MLFRKMYNAWNARRVRRQLGQATGLHEAVVIAYRAADGEESERTISPWEVLESDAGDERVLAECHKRNDVRAFRLDRIQKARPAVGIAYRPPEEDSDE